MKPVDRNLSLLALLFRAGESVIGGVGIAIAFATLQINLQASQSGPFDANQMGALADLTTRVSTSMTNVSAIFFTVGSTVFFYVYFKSGYIPRLISGWGAFASLVYMGVWFLTLLQGDNPTVTGIGSIPILIAVLSTALWLLIVGIKTQHAPVSVASS